MRATQATRDSNVRGTRYVTPLVWAAIAVLALLVAPNWRDLLTETGRGDQRETATGLTGDVGETAVPAASSVFTGPSYPVVEHVQAF